MQGTRDGLEPVHHGRAGDRKGCTSRIQRCRSSSVILLQAAISPSLRRQPTHKPSESIRQMPTQGVVGVVASRTGN
jgi:hypothetical protein